MELDLDVMEEVGLSDLAKVTITEVRQEMLLDDPMRERSSTKMYVAARFLLCEKRFCKSCFAIPSIICFARPTGISSSK